MLRGNFNLPSLSCWKTVCRNIGFSVWGGGHAIYLFIYVFIITIYFFFLLLKLCTPRNFAPPTLCLWSRQLLFPGTPCLFQQEIDMELAIQCVCLTGLPAVQICLLLKIQCIMKRRIRQRQPGTVVYTKSGQKINLQNCNNWYLQFPNYYKMWLKEKVMLPSDKHASVPTFFECVAGINFKMCLYLTSRIKFISKNADVLFSVLPVLVNVQTTYFSFYCIFRKCPNFYGNCVFRSFYIDRKRLN